MQTETVDKHALARALGVATRTVERWVQQGCPHTRDDAGGLVFVLAEVHAWREQATADGPRSGVPGGTPERSALPPTLDSPRPAAPREAAQRADAVKKIAQARQQEHDLEQEKGLKDLDLADRIKAAKSTDDLLQIALETTSLVARGAMKHQRAQALRQLLSYAYRALKERQATEETDGRIFLLTEQAREVAETFDRIGNGWRRRWLVVAARQHLEEDERELPGWDGDMQPVLDGLLLDAHGEPKSDAWPEHLPPPAVPAAKIVTPVPFLDDLQPGRGAL